MCGRECSLACIKSQYTTIIHFENCDLLQVSVDDIMIMEVLDAGKNRPGSNVMVRPIRDGERMQVGEEISDVLEYLDGIRLGELALLRDTLKQLSSLREFECEVILGPRLEPLIELDLHKQ